MTPKLRSLDNVLCFRFLEFVFPKLNTFLIEGVIHFSEVQTTLPYQNDKRVKKFSLKEKGLLH